MPKDERYEHLRGETWQGLLDIAHDHLLKNMEGEGAASSFWVEHHDSLTKKKYRLACEINPYGASAGLLVIAGHQFMAGGSLIGGTCFARGALLPGLDVEDDARALATLQLEATQTAVVGQHRPRLVVRYAPETVIYTRLVLCAVAQTYFAQLGLMRQGPGTMG